MIRPTGFVATCLCGAVVGALDFKRTDRAESARILGSWLFGGRTVSPIFEPTWSVHIEPCRCAGSTDTEGEG